MKVLDYVALKTGRGKLAAGARGTIVHENVPGEDFIVEFCDPDGRTIALEDLTRAELIPVAGDLPH